MVIRGAESVNEQDLVRRKFQRVRLLGRIFRRWGGKKNKELREIYAKAVCSDRHHRLTYLSFPLKNCISSFEAAEQTLLPVPDFPYKSLDHQLILEFFSLDA